jgi:DNA mismatch repair protein MutS
VDVAVRRSAGDSAEPDMMDGEGICTSEDGAGIQMASNIIQDEMQRKGRFVGKMVHGSASILINLLFRVGDFYETFSEDARITSSVLGIVLTKRSNGKASEVELAGFPHHALDTYLPKLVRAGYRVAICDQLEDPKATKTIVKRGVTEMVTPGTVTGDHLLDHRTNNFLASVYLEGGRYGLSFLDVSTGEFLYAEGDAAYAGKLLQGFQPSEVVVSRSQLPEIETRFGPAFHWYKLEDWVFQYQNAFEALLRQFNTHSLKGFGIEEERLPVIAAGAALQYLRQTEHHQISHLHRINRIQQDEYVWLDKFSIRNLEITDGSGPGSRSLLDVLDKTVSPMGARLLRRWLLMPLLDQARIAERHDAVGFLLEQTSLRDSLRGLLKSIGDLERLASKVSLEKVNPREMLQLAHSLRRSQELKEMMQAVAEPGLSRSASAMESLPELTEHILNTLHADAGPVLQKGNVIAAGVHADLDELRAIRSSGKEFIAALQQKETQRTGIGSLKVGFNNVFGYFLEVTHTHKHKVPEDWIRKQTLTNAERYITPELKEYEEKVLGAEEKILQLEESIFRELLGRVKQYVPAMQRNAGVLARMDCLQSFATQAEQAGYSRPEMLVSNLQIEIRQGRHPVIEAGLEAGQSYVPNDVRLDAQSKQILIITGPNMSGKSALLRQTALICLMAQAGSFVPASSASLSLIDRIFTRVGASDNLSSGESTFMVEMNETASIMNNLSARSLILLDEIGRGTSTYDGISIAWSLVEYLHNHPLWQPLTLFATHYHELNELEERLDRVMNFHVAVKESGDKVLFLRKLMPGGTEHSFGIHVARMAGMPSSIVERAGEVLKTLEAMHQKGEEGTERPAKAVKGPREGLQLSFFDAPDPAMRQLAAQLERLDVNTLTPVEALLKLHEWKGLLGKK